MSRWLYRIAAVLFAAFAAGHTYIFVVFRPPEAGAQGVLEAMNSVHFQLLGSRVSYGSLYVGCGLLVTVYSLFSAWLCWQLSGAASPEVGRLRGIFAGVSIAVFLLTWHYVGGLPGGLAGVIAGCVTGAALAGKTP